MSEKVFMESSSEAMFPVTYAEAHCPIRHGVLGITLICDTSKLSLNNHKHLQASCLIHPTHRLCPWKQTITAKTLPVNKVSQACWLSNVVLRFVVVSGALRAASSCPSRHHVEETWPYVQVG